MKVHRQRQRYIHPRNDPPTYQRLKQNGYLLILIILVIVL